MESGGLIRHAFRKSSLVSFISKDANLVFYLSVYPLVLTLQTSDYDVIIDVCVDSASLATLLKVQRHHDHDLIKIHAVR